VPNPAVAPLKSMYCVAPFAPNAAVAPIATVTGAIADNSHLRRRALTDLATGA
jgi:hypothetical protein